MKFTNKACILAVMAAIACSSNPTKSESNPISKESPKARIAVLDLKPDGIQLSEARKISELIRTEIINTGNYVVIERSQIDTLFKEYGFTQLGVTDENSAIKLGKLLAAQKILIGTAMKLGESIVITGRVVDIEKGIAEHGARVSARREEDLIDSISEFIAQLTGQQGTFSETKKTSTNIILKTQEGELSPLS
jgi:hypothetical protein